VVGGFRKATVNRFVDRHVWQADLFIVRGEFLTAALGRARHSTIARRSVRIMAPEDIILLKLLAARRKDVADVEEVVHGCKNLDLAYLRDWSRKLNISDRLEPFLSGHA
jgi:hypothetical protein